MKYLWTALENFSNGEYWLVAACFVGDPDTAMPSILLALHFANAIMDLCGGGLVACFEIHLSVLYLYLYLKLAVAAE